jgi:hypothetical protein
MAVAVAMSNILILGIWPIMFFIYYEPVVRDWYSASWSSPGVLLNTLVHDESTEEDFGCM